MGRGTGQPVEHGHTHHAASAWRGAARHRRRLVWAFVLVAVFFVVELVTALATNSLALLSDAGHLFTDVLGLGMALAAIHAADRGTADPRKTFGLYRLEILAALANTVLLFLVALGILFEAIRRLSDPPEVLAAPMLVVAVGGLAVNLVAFALLRKGAGDSINIEGAYLEVLADTLGSVGVIVAATIISTTGITLVDPVFGVAIGLFVLPRTVRLGRRALRILLQAAPPEVDLDAVEADLRRLPGVVDTHDLHVWTLTSGMEVASVHVQAGPDTDAHALLERARSLLRDRYGIDHATVQVEPARTDCGGCGRVGAAAQRRPT